MKNGGWLSDEWAKKERCEGDFLWQKARKFAYLKKKQYLCSRFSKITYDYSKQSCRSVRQTYLIQRRKYQVHHRQYLWHYRRQWCRQIDPPSRHQWRARAFKRQHRDGSGGTHVGARTRPLQIRQLCRARYRVDGAWAALGVHERERGTLHERGFLRCRWYSCGRTRREIRRIGRLDGRLRCSATLAATRHPHGATL